MCALIVWRWGLLCQGGLKWERCYNKYKNVGSSQRRKMEASYPADTARGWVEHSAASLQNACDFPFGCCYYLTLECTVNLSVASAAATSINPVSWIEKLLYHLSSSLHCLLFQFRIFFFLWKRMFSTLFLRMSPLLSLTYNHQGQKKSMLETTTVWNSHSAGSVPKWSRFTQYVKLEHTDEMEWVNNL